MKQGSKHAKKVLLREKNSDIRLFQTDNNKKAVNDISNHDLSGDQAVAQRVKEILVQAVNVIVNRDSTQNKQMSQPVKETIKDSSIATSSFQPNSGFNRIEKYCVKDDTARAKILWCLQSVDSHVSSSATGKQTALFPLMFSDSAIAQSMQLGRTKVSYSLTFMNINYLSILFTFLLLNYL